LSFRLAHKEFLGLVIQVKGILLAILLVLILILLEFNLIKSNVSYVLKFTNEITNKIATIRNFSVIQPSKSHLDYRLPARLKIPTINVDAPIKHMGLTKAGNMEAPKSIYDLGWYSYGPFPGMEGSAVIAGHLGVETRGVFADLKMLKIGDEIFYTDISGQVITFVVRGLQEYSREDRPPEVFSSSKGVHLNLITCIGEWDNSLGGIANRLVVFTDMVE